jgi:hypothetical protein
MSGHQIAKHSQRPIVHPEANEHEHAQKAKSRLIVASFYVIARYTAPFTILSLDFFYTEKYHTDSARGKLQRELQYA